jgi:hypothetical protein
MMSTATKAQQAMNCRIRNIVLLIAIVLFGGHAEAAPIAVPMIDDLNTYTFDGAMRIDLNDGVFGAQLNTRTDAFWFKTVDADPLQMLYEEGGRINGLNIFLEQGQVHVGAWANRSGSWLSQTVTADQWHHVAYVFDQGQLSLFVDLNLVQTAATGFAVIPSHAGANALGAVNGWTLVGNAPSDQLGSSAFYTGLLSGVTYDDAALGLTDLDAVATRTLTSPVPPGVFLLGSGLAALLLVSRHRRS